MNNYQFYLRYKDNPKQYMTRVIECKMPSRTKHYKELENSFNRGFIDSYGWFQL